MVNLYKFVGVVIFAIVVNGHNKARQVHNIQNLPNIQNLANVQHAQNVQNLPNGQSFPNVQHTPNIQHAANVQYAPNLQNIPNIQNFPSSLNFPNLQNIQNAQHVPNVQHAPNVQHSLNVQNVPNVQSIPIPVIKNVYSEYRGPVFLIKETDDANEQFVGLIVDGAIEMVRATAKSLPVPYNSPTSASNETSPESIEDPEYFAVHVNPQNIAHTQFSRSTSITMPLIELLNGVALRMPSLMVLKRQNHYEYYKNLMAPAPKLVQVPVSPPLKALRRRQKRDIVTEYNRLYTGDTQKKYEIVYTEDELKQAHKICTNVAAELVAFQRLIQQYDNNAKQPYNFEQFDSKTNTRNEPNVDTGIGEEYAIGTEYKFGPKST